MKKLLTVVSILMIALQSFAQGYMQDIAINPNQSQSKQYIAIALGGKKLLSNQKLPNTKYDYKGKFSSVYLPDFVAAIATELNDEALIITEDVVADMISDSIATINNGAEYDVFVAIVTQAGTDTLALSVLENTIGPISSTRENPDGYTLNCTGCFTTGKTWVTWYNTSGGSTQPHFVIYPGSENAISITGPNVISSDTGILYGTIEIRVYP